MAVRVCAGCGTTVAYRPYREGERAERGQVTLEEAASVLKVSEATVRRLITEKILPATQHCKGAPWVIRAANLESPASTAVR